VRVATGLRLGPILRKTTETTATVWVETDAPGTVQVRAGAAAASAETFTVHGHHYALCEVGGLAPDSAEPYTVEVDGERVWPPASSPHPPSLLRTLPASGAPVRLAFGSCRTPTDHSPGAVARYGPDALRAYALRLSGRRAAAGGPAGEDEPTALLLIGDQVYADELQPRMAAHLAEARRRAPKERAAAAPPDGEVVFYDEYAELYRQTWTDPDVRWLLSTVPSLMLFDDHDVRDDWNTSGSWRRDMDASPWWRQRIVSGLGSYWVYQHLGNLTAAQRAEDPLFAEVRRAAAAGRDAGAEVDAAALRAHTEPQSTLWSHEHAVGGSRVLMVDARASRDVADDADRSILGGPGGAWLDERLRGDTGHLIVATTLPFLLPRAVHHLEGWNEALCAGAWGGRLRGFAERLRRALDLEHWAAFRRSFDAVAGALVQVAAGERGTPPATALLLSGDVHFSYLARARPSRAAGGAAAAGRTVIAQLTSSPLCNRLPGKLRRAAWLSTRRTPAAAGTVMARSVGVARSPLTWGLDEGPWFGNAVATLLLDGGRAEVHWSFAAQDRDSGSPLLEDGPVHVLTPPAPR